MEMIPTLRAEILLQCGEVEKTLLLMCGVVPLNIIYPEKFRGAVY
jgi:hypothetical protein